LAGGRRQWQLARRQWQLAGGSGSWQEAVAVGRRQWQLAVAGGRSK